MRLYKFTTFFIIVVVSNGVLQAQNDFKLYNHARKLTHEKQWSKAIRSYDEMHKRYPNSRYADDAFFWKAYALEKEHKLQAAFNEYKKLIRAFPRSPWTDDALIHQIGIAEKFYTDGKQEWLTFLTTTLNHHEKNVRFQAALSLGKLGNPNAIPILKEISDNGDTDLQIVADRLLQKLNSVSTLKSKEAGQPSDIEILRNAKSDGGLTNSGKSDLWDGLFYQTKRYTRYRALKKAGEEWTQEELVRYGLWHILPGDQFDEYFQLTDDFDKKEWLRKFWKKWDPTPTTPANERRDEFMRRIQYARNHFGDEWEGKQTAYLTEQYLRPGWSMAPWDSRGELYIKFGEPDFRDTSLGFNQELWTYYRYNFDVTAHKYMTNIFGNSLQPGPLSKVTYKWNLVQFQDDIVYKQEFRYEIYKNVEPIKNFKLATESIPVDSSLTKINVSYVLSGDDLKFRKIENNYHAKYLQRYIVLNEDLREVSSGEHEYVLKTESKGATRAKNSFENNFHLQLAPGYYTLAIRIEDMNSNKLGIFLQDLNVE